MDDLAKTKRILRERKIDNLKLLLGIILSFPLVAVIARVQFGFPLKGIPLVVFIVFSLMWLSMLIFQCHCTIKSIKFWKANVKLIENENKILGGD